MVFLDDADAAWRARVSRPHADGLPESKVFVKTTIDERRSCQRVRIHELVEMLVDPAINLMATGPDPMAVYAYESADPVEALSFKVKGIAMSDFVAPAYFEAFHKPRSVRFDYMNKVTRPFEILKGGYQIIFKNGKWSQVFGSAKTERAFARENRRGGAGALRHARCYAGRSDICLSASVAA